MVVAAFDQRFYNPGFHYVEGTQVAPSFVTHVCRSKCSHHQHAVRSRCKKTLAWHDAAENPWCQVVFLCADMIVDQSLILLCIDFHPDGAPVLQSFALYQSITMQGYFPGSERPEVQVLAA